jgi:uridine phosphorylase
MNPSDGTAATGVEATDHNHLTDQMYHIGFGRSDLTSGAPVPTVLLSGDPDRSRHIAATHLSNVRVLSTHRGLWSGIGNLPSGRELICSTSGMGGPSASIVINELAQVGARTIIRVGTTGSIQAHVKAGSVVISSAALRRQGTALDIAPVEYPAAADPFLTVRLSETATRLGIEHHVGITASVDSFFEGQERSLSSANPTLLRSLRGMTDEYRSLGILNYEMESATLFVQGSVYGIATGCVCAVIAQRTDGENVVFAAKDDAIENAIKVAVATAESLTGVS